MAVTPRLEQVERRATEVRTPGAPFDDVRRLTVVRLDRLGDVVLTLPAVAALRQAYPAAHLAFTVPPSLVPIAGMLEGVDEIVGVEPKLRAIAGSLRALAPDLVVCISREGALASAAAWVGIRHRVGTGRRAWSPLFTRRVDEPRRDGGRHELEYALSFAHRCGAVAAPREIALRTVEGEEPARAWLERHDLGSRFVLIHAGSGGSCPPWPPGHFARLAEILSGEGWRVAFSIGPEDSAVATALDSAPRSVRNAPRLETSLPIWAAVARQAAACIGNSTGPLHLAAALGTVTIGLYPPWSTCSAARWGPYSKDGWAIVADGEDAARWGSSERRSRGRALMAEMPPDSVAAMVWAVLNGDRHRGCPR